MTPETDTTFATILAVLIIIFTGFAITRELVKPPAIVEKIRALDRVRW